MSDHSQPKHSPPLDEELGEITPEEAAEAAELTRLLVGKSGASVSEEALIGVALLRAEHEGELSGAAFARIEAELLEGDFEGSSAPTQVSWNKLWWWLLAALLPAAGTTFLVLNETAKPGVANLDVVRLPTPNVGVLEAQASWLTSDAKRPDFEREMRDYRAQVMALLDAP